MRSTYVVLAACLAGSVACGDDAAPERLPYPADKTTLIGDDLDNPDGLAGYRVLSTPDGSGCINLDDACIKPQAECGDDGAVDVLVDDMGAVVDVICYPTDGVTIEKVEGDLENVGNNVVLVLDDEADGVDIEGDVTIDGNNVTLYGHGPATSVIGGDLIVDKNNALVRGVRIQGDVTIDKNNPSIVDCVIEGDLNIRGNNVSVAACEVWGKLIVEGNNAVLVGNKFALNIEVRGNNLKCNGNVSFTDTDGDHKLDANELGADVVCESKGSDSK